MIEIDCTSQSLKRKLAIDYVDLLVGRMRVREIENRSSEVSEKNAVWNCLKKEHLLE